MSTSLKTELYTEQREKEWPKEGKHILAQFDDKNIIVYQAFCPEIADYAAHNGKFGGPRYSFTRMTWIKTNFLWMMYRSNWASSRGQERILAISLSKEGFDEILKRSKGEGIHHNLPIPDDVRLQWDPDHGPKGGKIIERRAIQLGLRGDILNEFHEKWIQKITDITSFVQSQRDFVQNDQIDQLYVPSERVYIPASEDICRHILLDGFAERGKPTNRKECKEVVSILEGACCSEMLDTTLEIITQKQFVESEGTQTCKVVLSLGGAFNPVHTRHVQAMVEAKTWLEEKTHFRVVAGYLAVAPDGYVKQKCKKTQQMCIKSEHRVKLCEIACEGHDWLKPYSKTVGSAEDCAKRVKQELNLTGVETAVIYGADRAISKAGTAKWHKQSSQVIVCLGRVGETEQVKTAFVEDKKIDLVRNENFFIVPKELDNVSSSEIRKMISAFAGKDDDTSRDKAMKDITDLNWISEKEGQYIADHFSELYLT